MLFTHILPVFSCMFQAIALIFFITKNIKLHNLHKTININLIHRRSDDLPSKQDFVAPKMKEKCQWNKGLGICPQRGLQTTFGNSHTPISCILEKGFPLCYPLLGDSIKPNLPYYCPFLFYTMKIEPVGNQGIRDF